MKSIYLCISWLAVVHGKGLLATLQASDQLSAFASWLGQFPSFLEEVDATQDVHFLAVTNTNFQPDQTLANYKDKTPVVVGTNVSVAEEVVRYHILTEWPQDMPLTSNLCLKTGLIHPTYSQVTRGQRLCVRQYSDNHSMTDITVGAREDVYTSESISFDSGFIHPVDNWPQLPVVMSTFVRDFTTRLNNWFPEYAVIQAAGLADLVDSSPDLTIFLPDQSSWLAIGSVLMDSTPEQLRSILSYHIVQGAVIYRDMFSNMTLQSITGDDIHISVIDGQVYVNNVKVIWGYNPSTFLLPNGVVHFLDNVLNVDQADQPPEPATTGHPTYPSATAISEDAYESSLNTGVSQVAPITNYAMQNLPTVVTSTGVSTTTGASASRNPSRPATTSSTTVSGQNPAASSAGLSTGAKAGIGAGVGVGVLVGFVVVALILLRRRRRQAKGQGKTPQPHQPGFDGKAELDVNHKSYAELDSSAAPGGEALAKYELAAQADDRVHSPWHQRVQDRHELE